MTKNVAASVRAKLANNARATGRPFQEVLQYYGLERLYRLAQSQHRDRFLLKGALMLRVWEAPASRPTRDIDLLGYVDNEIGTVTRIMREVCTIPVQDDGLLYDPSTIVGARIKENADYEGVRIKFAGTWLLARSYDFVGADLAKAVQETFRNRDTSVETDPVALTPAFTRQETVRKQWTGFLKRSNLSVGPATLDEIREPLRAFLLPVAGALAAKKPFTALWKAPGPWQ